MLCVWKTTHAAVIAAVWHSLSSLDVASLCYFGGIHDEVVVVLTRHHSVSTVTADWTELMTHSVRFHEAKRAFKKILL